MNKVAGMGLLVSESKIHSATQQSTALRSFCMVLFSFSLSLVLVSCLLFLLLAVFVYTYMEWRTGLHTFIITHTWVWCSGQAWALTQSANRLMNTLLSGRTHSSCMFVWKCFFGFLLLLFFWSSNGNSFQQSCSEIKYLMRWSPNYHMSTNETCCFNDITWDFSDFFILFVKIPHMWTTSVLTEICEDNWIQATQSFFDLSM